MLTKGLFVGIIVAIILQRFFELRHSQRNAAYILAQGGRQHGDNFLGIVKLLQVSWWLTMIVEVWLLDRPFRPALAVCALIAIFAGQVLRYLSMRSLKWRWTLAIMTVPNEPVVDSGPYTYIRHPNWLGVILEIAGLPLIHGAYLTAIIFSVANAILMSKRIQTEEQALSENTHYASVFANKPRFLFITGFTRNASSF
ncbi:MAG: isoprenylcysteine carboxylmethyltransferase family protein [Xenococcus sp. MO_188.B8]|nr:isoprenylcysteine carboxylmethyltransferase family protein [Xenococcus sp. MO_188.B8]